MTKFSKCGTHGREVALNEQVPEETALTAKQDQETDAIRNALALRQGGASLDEIEAALAITIPRRTLMRRLAAMAGQGIITKSGSSRAARYHLIRSERDEPRSPEPRAAQSDMFVPLSKAGGEISRAIAKRSELRKPVGYNRDFLDSYRPNRSSYLTSPEKKHLASLGRTNSGEQAAGTYAQQILNRLMIDLSWNSSRLEGNTYSLLETQRLIELGEAAEGKGTKDAQMILNHKAAIEFLVQSVDQVGFNRRTILNLHALLADNLLEDPTAPGRLRQEAVGISGSVFLPLEVPQLIEECFDTVLATAAAITDPFEQAFFIMVQLPYLQPFIDVNKRVSRLAANIPLIRANLAPLSFVSVPDATYTQGMLGVYELNRVDLLKDVFLWAYERSAARYAALLQSLGQPDPFRFRYRTQLKDVIAEIIKQVMDQKAAAAYLPQWAADHVAAPDQTRFVAEAENELLGLHEGNFARYQVRPSEFEAWRQSWERKTSGTAKSKKS